MREWLIVADKKALELTRATIANGQKLHNNIFNEPCAVCEKRTHYRLEVAAADVVIGLCPRCYAAIKALPPQGKADE